jgi:hypothetical protein
VASTTSIQSQTDARLTSSSDGRLKIIFTPARPANRKAGTFTGLLGVLHEEHLEGVRVWHEIPKILVRWLQKPLLL